MSDKLKPNIDDLVSLTLPEEERLKKYDRIVNGPSEELKASQAKASLNGDLTFTNWDYRAAVIKRSTHEAYAFLPQYQEWRPVDFADVFHTAAVMWIDEFLELFPEVDLETIPWKEV